MFILDETVHEDIRPLAWLIGRWEGAGVVGYPTMTSRNFGQEIVVEHGSLDRPSSTEMGFWRVADGEAELLLTHPTGILELYFGPVEPGRISLRTDGVLRSAHAKEYSAATRLYGLVNSRLMWAMDMAAVGQPLQSHVE